jgi:hypothetical protein
LISRGDEDVLDTGPFSNATAVQEIRSRINRSEPVKYARDCPATTVDRKFHRRLGRGRDTTVGVGFLHLQRVRRGNLAYPLGTQPVKNDGVT